MDVVCSTSRAHARFAGRRLACAWSAHGSEARPRRESKRALARWMQPLVSQSYSSLHLDPWGTHLRGNHCQTTVQHAPVTESLVEPIVSSPASDVVIPSTTPDHVVATAPANCVVVRQ